MNDLVKRLRAGNNGQEIEAADKIEALEAEIARLTAALSIWIDRAEKAEAERKARLPPRERHANQQTVEQENDHGN